MRYMSQSTIRDFRKTLRKFERLIIDQQKYVSCCSGVTIAQCHTLLEIEHLGRTTTAELAGRMDLDKSTLSRTIDGLVNIGLVKRETHRSDRRFIQLTLSTQGRKVCHEINTENDHYYSKVMEAIPANIRGQVLEGFDHLVNALISSDNEHCDVKPAG